MKYFSPFYAVSERISVLCWHRSVWMGGSRKCMHADLNRQSGVRAAELEGGSVIRGTLLLWTLQRCTETIGVKSRERDSFLAPAILASLMKCRKRTYRVFQEKIEQRKLSQLPMQNIPIAITRRSEG
jgi:hypothetical protein